MPRIWFITGSSRGLGLAIAKAAVDAGDSIIVTARKPEQLAELVESYSSETVIPLSLDVTNNEQVIECVKDGHEKFRIDTAVNNVGYANRASVEDIDIYDFRTQVNTNFYGIVYLSKVAIPILRQQKSGHIFQISSIGGRVGTPGLSTYQSAKWAIGGFSTVLAQEAAPFGVKVTVVEPGSMKTDFAGSSMDIPEVRSELSIPSKIADIIIKVLEEEVPPLRLLIGADAVEYAGKAAEALAASDERWRELSVSSA